MAARQFIFFVLLTLIFIGCGGSPSGGFRPAMALTCTGNVADGGQSCDFSDGMSFSRHDFFRVTSRSDGHGTLQIVSETGVAGTGLRQINFELPSAVDVYEVHGELGITSWCDNNGAMSTWNAYNGADMSDIVGGKTFQLHDKETVSFTVAETIFTPGLPTKILQQNIFADLCARSTIHWVFNGSF